MTFEEFMKGIGIDPETPRIAIDDRVLWSTAYATWTHQEARIKYLQHSIAIYLGARDRLALASVKVDEGGCND